MIIIIFFLLLLHRSMRKRYKFWYPLFKSSCLYHHLMQISCITQRTKSINETPFVWKGFSLLEITNKTITDTHFPTISTENFRHQTCKANNEFSLPESSLIRVYNEPVKSLVGNMIFLCPSLQSCFHWRPEKVSEAEAVGPKYYNLLYGLWGHGTATGKCCEKMFQRNGKKCK